VHTGKHPGVPLISPQVIIYIAQRQ
jgi:hypothetical protein